jgi:hypothetical protein
MVFSSVPVASKIGQSAGFGGDVASWGLGHSVGFQVVLLAPGSHGPTDGATHRGSPVTRPERPEVVVAANERHVVVGAWYYVG